MSTIRQLICTCIISKLFFSPVFLTWAGTKNTTSSSLQQTFCKVRYCLQRFIIIYCQELIYSSGTDFLWFILIYIMISFHVPLPFVRLIIYALLLLVVILLCSENFQMILCLFFVVCLALSLLNVRNCFLLTDLIFCIFWLFLNQ